MALSWTQCGRKNTSAWFCMVLSHPQHVEFIISCQKNEKNIDSETFLPNEQHPCNGIPPELPDYEICIDWFPMASHTIKNVIQQPSGSPKIARQLQCHTQRKGIIHTRIRIHHKPPIAAALWMGRQRHANSSCRVQSPGSPRSWTQNWKFWWWKTSMVHFRNQPFMVWFETKCKSLGSLLAPGCRCRLQHVCYPFRMALETKTCSWLMSKGVSPKYKSSLFFGATWVVWFPSPLSSLFVHHGLICWNVEHPIARPQSHSYGLAYLRRFHDEWNETNVCKCGVDMQKEHETPLNMLKTPELQPKWILTSQPVETLHVMGKAGG